MRDHLKKINIMGKRVYVDDRFSDIVENGYKKILDTAEVMEYSVERSDLQEMQFGANARFDLVFFDEEDNWQYSFSFLLVYLDRWRDTYELSIVSCFESKYCDVNAKKTYSYKIKEIGDYGLKLVQDSFEDVFNTLCEKILLIDQLTD